MDGVHYKLISYPINATTPVWPGSPATRLDKHSHIERGDSANTSIFTIFNHTGTHCDAPRHFIPEGATIDQLPLERFIFERPLLLDAPRTFGEKIRAADLQPHAERIARADLLMLRTGFSRYRTEAPERYTHEGPAIAATCAEYLAANFPRLAAVAVDFVSIGSFTDKKDGEAAHRALFGGSGGKAVICAIEDVDMRELEADKLVRVFALPLLVEGADGSPVTMIAELARR
ncbi:MAG: cyclase family protein [Spirochaetaceae bacterium]|jgi:kynurenine formamidase|nr:cyclase family protein [Spirochaetaceae bacterium]